MAALNEAFCIWQWNCRGYLKKKATLQQYIRNSKEKPHIVLLQETLSSQAVLPGFRPVIGNPEGRGVCTLICNKLTHVTHDLKIDTGKLEHVMVEIVPGTSNRQSIFILNIYSSPKEQKQGFKTVLKKAVSIAGKCPLVIAGDFNAPHHTWGYKYNTGKGNRLWQITSELDLTLITDPSLPTRIGTSSCRDSTPDLTFVKNITKPQWVNLAVDLGSDHCILATTFPAERKKQREFHYTDWDKFRKLRTEREQDDHRPSLEQWVKQIKEDIQSVSSTIITDLQVERMDSRLAHLLEAKQALLNRWKGQRLNRRLRKKIAEVNRSVEEHCRTLSSNGTKSVTQLTVRCATARHGIC